MYVHIFICRSQSLNFSFFVHSQTKAFLIAGNWPVGVHVIYKKLVMAKRKGKMKEKEDK